MANVKSCMNCMHSTGRDPRYLVCARAGGMFCSTQRSHPNYNCDKNFSGWVEKEKPEAKKKGWWS